MAARTSCFRLGGLEVVRDIPRQAHARAQNARSQACDTQTLGGMRRDIDFGWRLAEVALAERAPAVCSAHSDRPDRRVAGVPARASQCRVSHIAAELDCPPMSIEARRAPNRAAWNSGALPRNGPISRDRRIANPKAQAGGRSSLRTNHGGPEDSVLPTPLVGHLPVEGER